MKGSDNVSKNIPCNRVHRIARMFNYINRCKVTNGGSKTDLILRASMTNSLISNAFANKLESEAATLAWIPQYCNFNKKSMAENFGQDVKNLVGEVKLIRDEFNDDDQDIDKLNSFSAYSKNIYLYHCYVDMVFLFTGKKKSIVIDGVMYEYKNKKYLDDAGEWSPIKLFHQHNIDLLTWKLGELTIEGLGIRQALHELVGQYKSQKGYEFSVKDEFIQPNAQDCED